MLQVVASMNARVFVGPRLCRDQSWLDISIDFSRCVFLGAGYLKLLPSFLRSGAALLLPYIHRIKSHHHKANQILVPEIIRRRGEARESFEMHTKALDMIQILERVSPEDQKTPEQIVDRQLGLAFAATHGTTNHIVNVMYDLAARWVEYGEVIRDEVEDALAKADGSMTKKMLNELSKLDSFMKESQRLEPGSACKTIKFPNLDIAENPDCYSVFLPKSHGPIQTFHWRDYFPIDPCCYCGGTNGTVL